MTITSSLMYFKESFFFSEHILLTRNPTVYTLYSLHKVVSEKSVFPTGLGCGRFQGNFFFNLKIRLPIHHNGVAFFLTEVEEN